MMVREIMSRHPKTLGRNDQLSLADDVMRVDRIRHLPVVDEDGRLCGILSQRDMFRGALAQALGYGTAAQSKMLAMLRVKEVMTTEVISTSPDTPFTDAAKTMLERKIGCLPVVDGERLVGIVTESDFVALAAR